MYLENALSYYQKADRIDKNIANLTRALIALGRGKEAENLAKEAKV